MSETIYKRVGETTKCPACGVQIYEGAYRCPTCLIYFCFKCRRRVQESESQSQCLNQKCNYYGKLLCKICVKQIPQVSTTRKELKESLLENKFIFIAFVILAIISAAFLLSLGLSGNTLVVATAILSIPPTIFISNFKKTKFVEEQTSTGSVSCCIACDQPVEYLNTGK